MRLTRYRLQTDEAAMTLIDGKLGAVVLRKGEEVYKADEVRVWLLSKRKWYEEKIVLNKQEQEVSGFPWGPAYAATQSYWEDHIEAIDDCLQEIAP